MNRITDARRAERQIRSVVHDLALDLHGIAVLTEAASGPFSVTPLIAAIAGAPRVVAVGRDSPYGRFDDVRAFIGAWARSLGLGDRIHFHDGRARDVAADCHLVTNLGFVRPIDADLIHRLPRDSAVALMFEPWEYRSDDIDLDACRRRGIPVLGTDESHPRLAVFPYVGQVVLKLLFETGHEIRRSNVVVIGSQRFGDEAEAALQSAGANVVRLDPTRSWSPIAAASHEAIREADALVVAEFQRHDVVVGGMTGIPVPWIAEAGATLIHVCGTVDDDALIAHGVAKHPPVRVRPGFMAASAAYLGTRPVVDLHAGGLKVGELLVRGLRTFGDEKVARSKAKQSGLALDF